MNPFDYPNRGMRPSSNIPSLNSLQNSNQNNIPDIPRPIHTQRNRQRTYILSYNPLSDRTTNSVQPHRSHPTQTINLILHQTNNFIFVRAYDFVCTRSDFRLTRPSFLSSHEMIRLLVLSRSGR